MQKYIFHEDFERLSFNQKPDKTLSTLGESDV